MVSQLAPGPTCAGMARHSGGVAVVSQYDVTGRGGAPSSTKSSTEPAQTTYSPRGRPHHCPICANLGHMLYSASQRPRWHWSNSRPLVGAQIAPGAANRYMHMPFSEHVGTGPEHSWSLRQGWLSGAVSDVRTGLSVAPLEGKRHSYDVGAELGTAAHASSGGVSELQSGYTFRSRSSVTSAAWSGKRQSACTAVPVTSLVQFRPHSSSSLSGANSRDTTRSKPYLASSLAMHEPPWLHLAPCWHTARCCAGSYDAMLAYVIGAVVQLPPSTAALTFGWGGHTSAPSARSAALTAATSSSCATAIGADIE